MENQNPFDKENLIETIKTAPDQLMQGLALSKGVKLEGVFDSIVLSGMGGSALVGELLQTYLSKKSEIHSPESQNKTSKKAPDSNGQNSVTIQVNRSYNLPAESYKSNCLNIISSYSGNTEETLSCFNEALQNNLNCVGVASGGKILEICQAKNIPFIRMPRPDENFQPRFATGYSFSAILSLIADNTGSIFLNEKDFEDAEEKLKSNLEKFDKLGREIAEKIQGKTPVIYAPIQYKSLAMIWKIMFNENSKTPAFWNYFPELSHNEMVGFTKPQGNFHFVMLRDQNDHSQNLKRLNITVGIFKEYGIDSTVLDIPEGDMLYRIFATLQIGSFASYRLAQLYAIDPTPVVMVEKLKKMLAEN